MTQEVWVARVSTACLVIKEASSWRRSPSPAAGITPSSIMPKAMSSPSSSDPELSDGSDGSDGRNAGGALPEALAVEALLSTLLRRWPKASCSLYRSLFARLAMSVSGPT